MELSRLRPVYEHEGPFATVYLEGGAPGEDAGNQMRLRWRALRERMEAAGASADVLAALDAELGGDEPGEEQADGRVLVANASGILLDEAWDAALGAGDDAHVTELPELGAYVREECRSVRELVVIADQNGAQVRQEVVAEQHEPRELDAEEVTGSSEEGVHKPRGGALSHNQIQRRADEAVGRNAKDVVDHVRKTASAFRPQVLVLAGDVQARQAVREELPTELAEILTETDRGGRAEHGSGEALTDELLRLAGEYSLQHAQQRNEQLRSGLAHEQAVQGHEQVAHAAEMGAVEVLLLEHGAPAKREALLLKVCTETSAAADLVAEDSQVTDGVAAILRFPMSS